MNMEAKELRLRLQNCLQTILAIKDKLDTIPFGASFLPELGSLEDSLAGLASLEPTEAGVKRVEEATARFLNELSGLTGRGQRGDADVLQ